MAVRTQPGPVFPFSLRDVALCAPDHPRGAADPSGLPADFAEVIGSTGDQFRDWFTRLCLYLVLHNRGGTGTRTGDTVVIGTEYGNSGALARLQRLAAEQGRRLSAQLFPNATSSSASAFVNMSIGATGRNMTVNAAELTPVITMWQALSALANHQSTTSHLLVGDVYSPEALLDAETDRPASVCRSGVVHGVFTTGSAFQAYFDFSADGNSMTAPAGARVWRAELGTEAPVAVECPDRNGAFTTARFLELVADLPPAAAAVLDCRTNSSRRAMVTVTRNG